MTIAAGINTTQGRVLVTSVTSSALNVTQAYVLTAINFPSRELQITQARILGTVVTAVSINTTQARVLAAVRGRIENRRLRAWAFSLDGHDFYVLRLGETSTLVHDLTTGQWSRWDSDDLDYWRVPVGMNWLGLSATSLSDGTTSGSSAAETQIVAGDDTFGLLWTLAPTQGYDDNPRDDTTLSFTRKVIGGVPISMRETKQVGAAYITASFGNPQITAATITLRTSEDFGRNWTNHGTITVTPGDYSQEFAWRSLGLIRAPGRIFEITDDGASVRIDGLDIR